VLCEKEVVLEVEVEVEVFRCGCEVWKKWRMKEVVEMVWELIE